MNYESEGRRPKAEGCEARSNLRGEAVAIMRGTKQSARHEAICEAKPWQSCEECPPRAEGVAT